MKTAIEHVVMDLDAGGAFADDREHAPESAGLGDVDHGFDPGRRPRVMEDLARFSSHVPRNGSFWAAGTAHQARGHQHDQGFS